MKMISLKLAARKEGAVAKVLRSEDKVPCVLYGNDIKNTQLVCEYGDLYKTYVKAGESTLVDLDADGKSVPALFHAIDFDPVTDKITHVDFYAVDMKKEIETKVPISFEGESLAVKDLGGVLVTSVDHLTVKCLPTNLPKNLSVSLESLNEFTDTLAVSAVTIPDGVTVSEDPEMVIATVQEPRKEEEVVPVVAEGEEAGEGAEGEKPADGEVPAEGGDAKPAEGGGDKPEQKSE